MALTPEQTKLADDLYTLVSLTPLRRQEILAVLAAVQRRVKSLPSSVAYPRV